MVNMIAAPGKYVGVFQLESYANENQRMLSENMHAVTPIEFFDANAMLGKPLVPPRAGCLVADKLAQTAGVYNISKWLAFSATAMDNDPDAGNSEILKMTLKKSGLFPCWVVLPHHTGEFHTPKILIERMQSKRIKAARIFLDSYRLELSRWVFNDLFHRFHIHKIPVFLELPANPAACFWDNLYQVCGAFNDMPVVLSGSRLTNYPRKIFPLFQKCKNLFIETAGYQVFRGLEYVCRNYGARRLIFSTRMPYFNPFPAVAAVNYAGISQTEKRLIAGGNLAGLLKGVVF